MQRRQINFLVNEEYENNDNKLKNEYVTQPNANKKEICVPTRTTFFDIAWISE